MDSADGDKLIRKANSVIGSAWSMLYFIQRGGRPKSEEIQEMLERMEKWNLDYVDYDCSTPPVEQK